jgi:hypothetical protein
VFNAEEGQMRDRVNGRADGKTALVKLTSGEEFSARSLHVAPDIITWTDPATGKGRSAPTAQVVSIEFRNRLRGTLEGLGLGLLVGAGSGGVIGWASYEEPSPDEWCFVACTPSESALLGAVFLGAGGIVFGGLAGWERGGRTRYVNLAAHESQ